MSSIVLETIQHSKLYDIEEVEPISDKDYAVLEEVRAVIEKHNYTDRFGLVLLHKHFNVADDEILMETTDEETRTSIVKAQKADGSEKVNTIQTMWKFGKGVNAVTECVLYCHYLLGHKQRHKKVGK
jgi:hypothetical protein